MSMEQEKVIDSSRHLLDAEAAEEELVGAGLKRRLPRPAKNLFDASHVSCGFVLASSNMSTITNEEEDPEPELQDPMVGYFEEEHDEAEPEETEFDVKGVLEKQNTHDLYCPKCNSCITRKVILVRKRGRPIPPKPIVIVPSEPTPISDPPREDDRRPEVFRCLSCFTFFIPKGNLRKLHDSQPLLDETRPTGPLEAREFDILKSIVYGGLVESIASLGVVSSAAGGGAATLNTLALAMANLISGLFVLVHNLRDLKNKQYDLAQTQTDVDQDQYFQNLGRRGKFGLHATVAVLSYLVFGLVAPITYGFSFRESDNRDYKIAALAAASLLCILVLALVKAHVSSKSYIKTGLYYLMMGFAASGISFLVGVLIDELLEKLGLFNTTSTTFSGVLSSISVSRRAPN